MTTVVIKSNGSTTQDVLIPDMGILIPQAGGDDTFVTQIELADIRSSSDLRTLVTDDAFGTDSSTLIINDGTTDIGQDDVLSFLDNLLLISGSAGRFDYLLSSSFAIPAESGVVYLQSDGLNTVNVPITLSRAATLSAATFRVDQVDPNQTFDMEILVNGSISRTLTLEPNNLSVATDTFDAQLSNGDRISVRVVRTGGSNRSTFGEIRATIELASTLTGDAPVSGTPTDLPDRVSRDSTTRTLIYVGRALDENTTTSDAEWQIYRQSLVNAPDSDKEYADGDTQFNNVWDNRESLTYSVLP